MDFQSNLLFSAYATKYQLSLKKGPHLIDRLFKFAPKELSSSLLILITIIITVIFITIGMKQICYQSFNTAFKSMDPSYYCFLLQLFITVS